MSKDSPVTAKQFEVIAKLLFSRCHNILKLLYSEKYVCYNIGGRGLIAIQWKILCMCACVFYIYTKCWEIISNTGRLYITVYIYYIYTYLEY